MYLYIIIIMAGELGTYLCERLSGPERRQCTVNRTVGSTYVHIIITCAQRFYAC